jgi:hypothetical protein
MPSLKELRDHILSCTLFLLLDDEGSTIRQPRDGIRGEEYVRGELKTARKKEQPTSHLQF